MPLDATYKTMRCELPLFILVVETNVNYTVVGSFITQNETAASIAEALHIFREWNPQWKPQYFMTDFFVTRKSMPLSLNLKVHVLLQ